MDNVYESAKRLCRELRRRQTKAEGILWQELRNRRLCGKKFLRQHPIFFFHGDGLAFFIADFYCAEHRLAVELDGPSHENKREYDEYRTLLLNSKAIRVIRFRNEEVERDLPRVLGELKTVLLRSTP